MFDYDQHSVLHIQETYGTKSCNIYEVLENEEKILRLNYKKEEDESWQSLSNFFSSVFLPHGYPHSVSKDYLQYQIWDSIQAFASSITGSICTHAVLKGAGVGNNNATPLAATITWLYKDGTSMVGRIVFAWLQGTKLDCECKKWRLFADVMNDIAMFLDLMSAYFQNHFMFIICASGLLKALVGVAGSSTRAALTQHQARQNNMADVSAKDGSQETLVNLLALICSLILIPIVTDSFMLTWIMYFSMTVLHITANYFAVRSVTMETFNIARYKIFADHYFSTPRVDKQTLSVDEVNAKESVFFSIRSEKAVIKLGCSFKELIKGRSCTEIREVLQLYKESDYMLCMSKTQKFKVVIMVAFSRKATVLTQMEALHQACFLVFLLKTKEMDLNVNSPFYYESSTKDFTKHNFSEFIQNANKEGFNVKTAFFETDIWRVDW